MASDKKSSSNKKSGISKFFQNVPWKWVIIGVILIILIPSIIKVVNAINKVPEALIAALGPIAKGLGDMLEDCTSTGDCTIISNCDQCNSQGGGGCACDQNNKCQNVKPKGSGGFFSLSCGFFIFAIVAAGIYALVKLVSNWKPSATVADTAERLGLKDSVYSKKLAKKIEAATKEAIDAWEKENGTIDPDTKKIIETKVAQGVTTQDSYDTSHDKIADPVQRLDAYKKAAVEYKNNIEKSGVDDMLNKLPDEKKSKVSDIIDKFEPHVK